MSISTRTSLSKRQAAILELIRAHPGIRRLDVAKKLGIQSGQVELAISGFDSRGYRLAEGNGGRLTLIENWDKYLEVK